MIQKFLTGNTNKLSSKRLWGSICMLEGVLGKGILFVVALFYKVEDFRSLDTLLDGLLMFGSGLLGIGLFELMAKTKKTKSNNANH